MTRRADSGSRRSCSDTEPMRSAKTTVTSLRAIALSTTGRVSEAPQALQNRASGGLAVPHAAHAGARAAPQALQKRADSGLMWPQLVHVIAELQSARRGCVPSIAGQFT